MDLVGVQVELGFMLFTLNIVQFLDVTDLLDCDQMCGYLTFDFDIGDLVLQSYQITVITLSVFGEIICW